MESPLEDAKYALYGIPQLGVSIVEQLLWSLWTFDRQVGQLNAWLQVDENACIPMFSLLPFFEMVTSTPIWNKKGRGAGIPSIPQIISSIRNNKVI